MSQMVLDVLPQVMLEKLSLSLEEDCEGPTPPLSQSTSQKVNKNLDQEVYCGGIVYHYLHPNQQSTMTQEKHSVKAVAKRGHKPKILMGLISTETFEDAKRLREPGRDGGSRTEPYRAAAYKEINR